MEGRLVRGSGPVEGLEQLLGELVKKEITAWIAKPDVLRMLLEDQQRLMPVTVTSQAVIVTKYDDVVEVLKQNQNFTVTDIYSAKMKLTSGDFILGMEDTPQFRREAAILHAAVKMEDMARVQNFDQEACRRVVEAAAASRRLDVAGGLFRVVPARLVEDYFGVPGPDEATLMRWTRTIFWEIFLNLGNDPTVAATAVQSSGELKAYLDALIAKRKPQALAGQGPDDFLGRLLRMQANPETALDDEGVRRNIGGVIVGAVDTTSTAASQALDELPKRPQQLAGARQAALEGNDPLFLQYVYEALRFHPLNPLILRHSEKDYGLAAGTKRQTLIPGNREVYAMTFGGMFDPDRFPDPNSFRTDRPLQDYLIFGYGQHRCFGEPINKIQVPELLKSVVRLKGLRRAEGGEGELRLPGSLS